ncbi:MAG TPA: hypothetical protein VL728_19375 [Cyclobacteriaceae bacterium]|jgi:hypothetical protein|nr:hypothetical protein [Cyclobacteriaceae bacterium]
MSKLLHRALDQVPQKVKDKTDRKHESVNAKAMLREMGQYFEIDPKKVNLFIRQNELSGKL